jgi:hypothetical protein
VGEEIPAVLVLHEFYENDVNWEAYKIGIGECGGCFDCSINHVKHIVTCLSWEGFFALIYSVFPIHAKDGIGVDHLAEVFHGVKPG